MNLDFGKGYRTLAFNIVTFIVLAGGALTGMVENPETLRWIAIIVTLGNVGLRMLTTTPVPTGDNA